MTTTNNPLPTVNTYLRRNLIDEDVRDSILELMAAYRENHRLEAAVERLTLHCTSLAGDINHGLTLADLKDELSHANQIALGLVDPYEPGGRLPF